MKDEEENKKKECFKGHELQQRTTCEVAPKSSKKINKNNFEL